MASELEDFLRRAAQRRAEHSAARAERPQTPHRPQYTDRDRERVPTMDDADDEVVVADLVQTSPLEEARERMRAHAPSSAGAHGVGENRAKYPQPGGLGQGIQGQGISSPNPSGGAGMLGGVERSADEVPAVSDTPAVQALLRLMTDPDGIDQAILAREILDRPTHRW